MTPTQTNLPDQEPKPTYPDWLLKYYATDDVSKEGEDRHWADCVDRNTDGKYLND